MSVSVIGLDIGTTTICASAVNCLSGKVEESITVQNKSFLAGAGEWEKIQDPELILSMAKELISRLVLKFSPVDGIGVTGQMHGILYVDAFGNAVSPLYTWQDGRGDLEYRNGESYAQALSLKTGYRLSAGFGAVTHYYNLLAGMVPGEAESFCTIQDYVAMRLAGRSGPVIHPSDAASLGLFDLQRACFDETAIENAGMKVSMFPCVADGFDSLGTTGGNIPVFIAIGDNQASFIGSVRNMKDSILVNVGTGSQISLFSEGYFAAKSMETRPCLNHNFLLVGSSLCGGRAYAVLEGFFRSAAKMAGAQCENLYPAMDKLAEGYDRLENRLEISTRFCGTRDNPDLRGFIDDLGIENFTPQHFICGVLEGVVDELWEMYSQLDGFMGKRPSTLIGSGNGIRKSVVLQEMFSKKFGMKVMVPLHHEEAAYGAALFAMVGAGYHKNIEYAQKIIHYQANECGDSF